jgi:hypothetical protein
MNQRGWMMVLLAAVSSVLTGCSNQNVAVWPPPPKTEQERRMIEAALRAVDQFDRWEQVACVVEHRGADWRVQAWRIVHPEAHGRDQCVPWAVRGIKLDDDATVIAYENHL